MCIFNAQCILCLYLPQRTRLFKLLPGAEHDLTLRHFFSPSPLQVINIIAFTEDVPAHWMSVTISWCTVVSAFLHPPLLVLLCNRYKKVCVRFFRYAGESCGCITVTPARPRLNGNTNHICTLVYLMGTLGHPLPQKEK